MKFVLISLLTALFLVTTPGTVKAEAVPVDLELVVAVDVSGSVDWQEAQLQRDGYVAAFRSPEVIKAIKGGILGKIAVTYVEWAGDGFQTTILPWTLIKDENGALEFADKLSKTDLESGPWTSISSLIDYAVPQFASNDFEGTRRVIDISGDGPNNTGRLVTNARDEAIRQGIIINGLPIINDRLQPSGRKQIADLDKYYTACVIGGPGAFIVIAHDFKDFARAARRKLVFEIANLTPPEFAHNSQSPSLLYKANIVFEPGCDVGERRLQRRRLFMDEF